MVEGVLSFFEKSPGLTGLLFWKPVDYNAEPVDYQFILVVILFFNPGDG